MSNGITHYMPQIYYHDRKALLNVDIHPVAKDGRYKFVTSSVQNEIRIWEFVNEQPDPNAPNIVPITVNFVANLNGHNSGVNQVKFSQNKEVNLLASGDCHGRISIWQLSDTPPPPPTDDMPQNKENWVRIKVLNHESDVTSLCWSPCGKYLASVSNDDALMVHEAVTGKRVFSVSYLRHFPNGVSWDPLGKYIVTMSTDRKMDLLDAAKGTKLRTFGVVDLPSIPVGNVLLEEKQYKIFHDEQLVSFQRGVSFSPCGQLIVAPCGRLEIGASDIHCSLVFKRWELEKDRPAVILPSEKPIFMIRFCPKILQLVPESKCNYSGIPYRLIWIALTKDSAIFYDSQHPHAIGLVENLHYNNLTDVTWSPDGEHVIISSMEGYCSFLKLNFDVWGEQIDVKELPACPPSPQLIQSRKRAKKEKKEETKEEEEPKIATPTTPKTPRTPAKTSTPKSSCNLLKFLQKPGASAPEPAECSPCEPKAKKRITVTTLE